MLVQWLLRSTVLLAFTFVLLSLLTRARPAHRHLLWLFAIAASALMATAAWWPAAPVSMAFDAMEIVALAVAPAERAVAQPALPIYAIISALLLMRLAVAHARAWLLLRRARPWTDGVLITAEVNAPFTAGILRPAIVLPAHAERWSKEQLAIVLAHERAHVQRHDVLTQLLVDLHAAVAWANPFAWVACIRMHTERELAADAHVLASGAKGSTYAQLLLSNASVPSLAGVAMASPSTLARRIEAIVSKPVAALPRWLVACAAFVLALGTVALGCGSKGPEVAQGQARTALADEEPTGSLEPELIKGVVRDNREKFRKCYEDQLQIQSDLDLDATLHFTIERDGTTSGIAVNIQTSTPTLLAFDVDGDVLPRLQNPAAIQGCLSSVVKQMQYPRPQNDGAVIVHYPMHFEVESPGSSHRLNRDDVLSVVQSTNNRLQLCGAKGKVIAKWVIQTGGFVRDVRLENAMLSDAQKLCMISELEQMRFPASADKTPVTFPFTFR